MNPNPDSDRSVPVTAERTHDGMTKQAGLLAKVIGAINLGDVTLDEIAWTHKPALDGRPEMWRSKVNNVEIWCKEVDPSSFRFEIAGLLEVKIKEVTQHQGGRGGRDEKSQYLYVNVLPLPAGSTPTAIVSIRRPPKINGIRRLPMDFDPEADFSVDRQGQPWQVITVQMTNPDPAV